MAYKNENGEYEISLLEILGIFLHYKILIIVVTVLFMIMGVSISVVSLLQKPEKSIMPNKYTPEALMLINESGSSGGGLSSMLASSGLSSFASLAGVKTGSSNSGLAQYFTTTATFLDPIIERFNLIERYKIEDSPKTNSRKALQKVLKANYDDKSGVFSISFEDIDPEFACEVVNYSVGLMEDMYVNLGIDKNLIEKRNLEENIQNSYNEILRLQKEIQKLESSVTYGGNAPAIMNDVTMLKLEFDAQQQVYKQLKTQYEILKIQMASDTPAFQILEKAEVPDKKSGPSRGSLCIVLTFVGFILSCAMAFARYFYKDIKNDPESLKLLGLKE